MSSRIRSTFCPYELSGRVASTPFRVRSRIQILSGFRWLRMAGEWVESKNWQFGNVPARAEPSRRCQEGWRCRSASSIRAMASPWSGSDVFGLAIAMRRARSRTSASVHFLTVRELIDDQFLIVLVDNHAERRTSHAKVAESRKKAFDGGPHRLKLWVTIVRPVAPILILQVFSFPEPLEEQPETTRTS